MALRCRFCGEVLADQETAPAAPAVTAQRVAARALCPECGDDEIAEILRQEQILSPAPAGPPPTRCPACGRAGALRPLTPAEARTYEACGGDGYPPRDCARVVMVRYGIEG